MPEPTNPPPAAGAQQPDVTTQIASLTTAVAGLAAGQQKLVDALSQQQAATQQQQPAGKPGALTADDVGRIVGEKLQAFQTSQQQSQQRQQFVGDKLKDVPAVYHTLLGNDPAQWPQQEQKIRDQFKADLAAAGVKAPSVSGDAGTGGSATPAGTAAVDVNKLSATQKIEMGLKQSPPARGTSATLGTIPAAPGSVQTTTTPSPAAEAIKAAQ